MIGESKKTKSFDCIEFKRRVQEGIYEDIKNLSPEEQIAYFRHKAEDGPLGDWWRQVKEQGIGQKP